MASWSGVYGAGTGIMRLSEPAENQFNSTSPRKERAKPWCFAKLRQIEKNIIHEMSPGPVTKVKDCDEVSNYVFLDVEATGLASANPRTRITELSLVAVTKAQFAMLRRDLRRLKYKSDPEAIMPRVLNKLTLCFSPQTQIPALVASRGETIPKKPNSKSKASLLVSRTWQFRVRQ